LSGKTNTPSYIKPNLASFEEALEKINSK
jgi:hypothetical protein